MSASASGEFIAPGERPVSQDHPFVEIDTLYVFRRARFSEPLPDNPDVVRSNPGAERAHRIIEHFQAVSEAYPGLFLPRNLVLVDTHPTVEATVQEFLKHGITGSEGVVVVGGDGKASKTHEAARRVGFDGPMDHFAAGNACDLAHMLFRAWDIKRPAHAMAHSRLASLHPLEITVKAPGQATVKHEAEYCFSLGGLLYGVAAQVGSQEHRYTTESMNEAQKLAYELRMTLGKIATTNEVVTIEDNYNKERNVSDLLFTNGSRMAKQVRFRGINLLEPGFGRLEVKESSKSAVLATFARARAGRFPHHAPDEPYTFRVKSSSGKPIRFQKDGETDEGFEIPSDSEVTVKNSNNYTRQATTR